MSTDYDEPKKERSYIVTLLLAFLLGGLGIHRFYTGYILIGVIQLLTGGGCGIWALIDLISIALDKYKDADDHFLTDVNPGCGMFVLIWLVIAFILGGISMLLSMFSVQ